MGFGVRGRVRDVVRVEDVGATALGRLVRGRGLGVGG